MANRHYYVGCIDDNIRDKNLSEKQRDDFMKKHKDHKAYEGLQMTDPPKGGKKK